MIYRHDQAHDYYILDDARKPQPVSVTEWASWLKANTATCLLGDERIGRRRVRTVFHGHDPDVRLNRTLTPRLWSTLFYASPDDLLSTSGHTTEATASQFHARLVAVLSGPQS